MTFSVRLRRYNGTSWENAYTFPVNPFVSPSAQNEHNDAEPPRITAVRWAWALEALLPGPDALGAWGELRAAIEGEPPAQGIQLLVDGVVVEDISPEGGYQQVKIEALDSPKTDTQWTVDLTVKIKVSGLKRIADPNAPDPNDPPAENNEDPVGALEQTLTYSYDPAGLLTKTLEGEVASASGGAETLARAFALALPGADFAYETRGPEGVDVTILDQGGTRARFTSVVRQNGETLPAGVAPDYSKEVEVETSDGEITTTTSVSAQGPGALAAVRSARPSGRVVERIRYNTPRRTASATYVQRVKDPNAPLTRRHRFSISGGGRPVRWTRRTGGRVPVKHVGAPTEVLIDEEVTVERIGPKPKLTDFKFPPPLNSSVPSEAATGQIVQDTSKTRIEGPDRQIAKDESGEKWTATLHRSYAADRFYESFNEVLRAVVAPGDSSTLDAEALRQDKGLPDA